MSGYKDFIQDFPDRCRDVLGFYYQSATEKDREVTLLLMVASCGFVFPYERLRSHFDEKTREHTRPHPAGDREKHPDAAEEIDKLLKGKFLGSDLLNHKPSSWKFLTLRPDTIAANVEGWGLEKAKEISREKPTKNILKIIRNALAHGHVRTRGNPIEELLFLSAANHTNPKKYELLIVDPADFLRFVCRWFDFLVDRKIPQELVSERLKILDDEAA